MRIVFLGGTGPVGQAALPHLLAAGHVVAVAHSGTHEPAVPDRAEHLHGPRDALLTPGGAVERWRPEVVVDTFAGGATAAKAGALAALAGRVGAGQVVAVSSIDVYRHSMVAGVGGFPAPDLPLPDPLPLPEDAPLRDRAQPMAGDAHDNVAAERALHGAAPRVTALRPGAIYGPALHAAVLREWWLVGRVARGERALPLPGGGTQLFHRVALDRVGRAIAAAVDHAPEGFWACNVADPRDLSYGALAALVAEELDWTWEPADQPLSEADHPWAGRHPVLVDTRRLTDVLRVTEPDPLTATRAQIRWLWEHRDAVAQVPPRVPPGDDAA